MRVQKPRHRFDEHIPDECSDLAFFFAAEHYKALETAVTNVVALSEGGSCSTLEFCSDVAFLITDFVSEN
jgi:hypothetical protein